MRFSVLYIFVCLFFNTMSAQTSDILHREGDWYFGVELGINQITSFEKSIQNKSIQAGLSMEVFLSKHLSITGRVKYFKTGVSLEIITDKYTGTFRGTVIAFPLNLKWSYKITNPLKGYLNIGFASVIETQSDYNFPKFINTDEFPKSSASLNIGLGFEYFLTNKMALYSTVEQYIGTHKGNYGFWGPYAHPKNIQLNIGAKFKIHHFTPKKRR